MSLPNFRSFSAKFDNAIKFVLPHEVVFEPNHQGNWDYIRTENVSGDKGGLTKYGIDSRSHPGLNISELSLDRAVSIYYDNYWSQHGLERFPSKIGTFLFDVYVNGGPGIQMLQRAINETKSKDVAPLAEDNMCGPKTIAALNDINESKVIASMKRQRDERYKFLASDEGAKDPQKKFLPGWLNRNNDLMKFLGVSAACLAVMFLSSCAGYSTTVGAYYKTKGQKVGATVSVSQLAGLKK